MTIERNTKGKGLESLTGFIGELVAGKALVGVTKDTNARPDGGSNALIGMVHEFGSPSNNIPERSHLRAALAENNDKYAKIIAGDIPKAIQGGLSVYDAYSRLGTMAANDVKLKITQGSFTPLKEKTIERKGSSKPLIDDGHYRNSITYTVEN